MKYTLHDYQTQNPKANSMDFLNCTIFPDFSPALQYNSIKISLCLLGSYHVEEILYFHIKGTNQIKRLYLNYIVEPL